MGKEEEFRAKHKKLKTGSDFATHWDEMKDFQRSYLREKKRFVAKNVTFRMPLNFNVYIMSNSVKPVNIGRILYKETFKIEDIYSYRLEKEILCVKLIVTHNPHGSLTNFNPATMCCKYCKSGWQFGKYEWYWLPSIENWKRKNYQRIKSRILRQISGRKGFEYLDKMLRYY